MSLGVYQEVLKHLSKPHGVALETESSSYAFGPFVLDSRSRTLLRESHPLTLTSKTFDLLLLLVENNGRTLGKDELMEILWPDTVVEEANLTQMIFLLRKALGDDPREAEYILTVHRRGYRFIADVRKVSEGEDRREWRLLARPRRVRAGAGVIVILSLAVIGLLVRHYAQSRPRQSASLVSPIETAKAPAVSLALLPLKLSDENRELRLLGVSMVDLLMHRLSTLRDIRVVALSDDGPLDEASLTLLAKRARLEYLLTGTLRSSDDGTKAHLVVGLWKAHSTDRVLYTPIGRYDIPFLDSSTDTSVFVAVRDRIVEHLKRQLLPFIKFTAGSDVTPRRSEAYRLYLIALDQVRQATCGQAALALLEQSLEIDDRFAPAWEAYGWAQYNLASFCGRAASHYQEALKAAEHALQLAPTSTRAISLKAAVLVETGRVEEAFEHLLKSPKDLLGDPQVSYMMSYALRYAGYSKESRRWLEGVVAREPIFLALEGWSPNTLLYLGELDKFLELLPAADTPLFRYYRGFAEFLRDRPEEACRVLSSAFQLNPNDIFARLSQALLATLEGRSSESRVLLEQLKLQRAEVGSTDGEVSYKMAQLCILAGDARSGLEQLRLAVDQGFFNPPYFQSDPVLKPVRSHPRFQEIFTKAKARHEAFGKRFQLID